MQVGTLSARLGLGSELVDWYRDATSVPHSHLLIDVSPRAYDRLRYCTNIRSIPSKIYIPDRLKQSEDLDDEHKKSLYSPGVPIIFPQMQKSFPSDLPKTVIWFLCECMTNLLKGNLQSIKDITRQNFEARFDFCLQNVQLGSKEGTFWRPKEGYSSLKLLLLPSLTMCLHMEQIVLVPASVCNKSLTTQSVTKQEFPNYQPSQNPTYQDDSLKKEINKKSFSKVDSLVDKNMSCPRIKLSNLQTLISDGVETEIFLLDFAQQLRRKNADVPEIYFILLDAAGISTESECQN